MFPIVAYTEGSELPDHDIMYIITKKGMMLKKSIGFFESLAPIKEVSTLDALSSYAKLNIEKIPQKEFCKIVSFFKWAYKKYHSEAIVILHYNDDKKDWKIECPEQIVSAGSVSYEASTAKSLSGYVRIGTIHSHGSMSAFHSGTDDNDEREWDGLHITFGRMNEDFIGIATSIVANGTRFTVKAEDYIDGIGIDKPEPAKIHNAKSVIGRYPYQTYQQNDRYGVIGKFIKGFPQSWQKKTEDTFAAYATKYPVNNLYATNRQFANRITPRSGPIGRTTTFTHNPTVVHGRRVVGNFPKVDYTEFEFHPCSDCIYKDYKLEMEDDSDDGEDIDNDIDEAIENSDGTISAEELQELMDLKNPSQR